MKLNDYYKRLRQGNAAQDGKHPGQARDGADSRAGGKLTELSDEELKDVTGGGLGDADDSTGSLLLDITLGRW